MFLDDSACNLSSLNLAKFVGPGGQFDVEAYRHAVDTLIVAQDMIVDSASYPREKIALNSRSFRPLGLGYANLGALLMSMGIPYDSDQGRAWAGALTAIMCGQAYLTSARLAEAVGPFPGYPENERSEEHTSELQSHLNIVCRLLLEKKNIFIQPFFSERYHLRKRVRLVVSLFLTVPTLM